MLCSCFFPSNISISTNTIRYVPQGSSFVATNPSLTDHVSCIRSVSTLSPGLDRTDLAILTYTLDDSYLFPIPFISDSIPQEAIHDSEGVPNLRNVHEIQTRSKIKYIAALTASVISNNDHVDS